MRLLTAASEVRLWNIDNTSNASQLRPIQSWNPFLPNDSVGACAWSNDNAVLVLTGRSSSETRIVAFRTDTESVRNDAVIEEHPATIALSSSGRYAVCGAESGKLFIVDLKTGRTKRKFDVALSKSDEERPANALVSPVTCAAFNAKDTLVVAGTRRGALHIFNVQTQFAYAPLLVNGRHGKWHESAMCQFAFSAHNAALVATAYEDGSLGFWNVTERAPITRIERAHAAVCTSACFSPVSDQLAVSAGLDGRFALYDVASLRRIALVRATPDNAPLTDVDLFADGFTLACSTQLGAVYFFDLRSLGTASASYTSDSESYLAEPVCCLPRAHAAPVRVCRFEHTLPEAAVSLCAATQANDSTVSSIASVAIGRGDVTPSQPDLNDSAPASTCDRVCFGVSFQASDSATVLPRLAADGTKFECEPQLDANNNRNKAESETLQDQETAESEAAYGDLHAPMQRKTSKLAESSALSTVGIALTPSPIGKFVPPPGVDLHCRSNLALDAISPLRTAEQMEASHNRSSSLTLTCRSRSSDASSSMTEERYLREMYREFRFAGEVRPPSAAAPQTPVRAYDRSRSRSTPRSVHDGERVTSTSASTLAALRQGSLHETAEKVNSSRRVLVDADSLARMVARLEALEERLEATEERLRSETRNAHLDFILLIREQNERINEVLAHLRLQSEFREENTRLRREIVELRKMY